MYSERKHSDAAGSKPVRAVVYGDLNLVRCLRNVPVTVATSSASDVTLLSRYCESRAITAPPTAGEAAVRDLERLGEEHAGERPVLYYGTDALLLLISRFRERLARHFRFLLPDDALVEALLDKGQFATLALERELPVPRTVSGEAIGNNDDILQRLELPCVVKPKNHTGWLASYSSEGLVPRKALVAGDGDALIRAIGRARTYSDGYVVQEYVRGGEDQIHSYHAFITEDGAALGEFAGKKIRTYPRVAGISTYLELVKDPSVLDLGRRVVAALGLVGPVKIDFKRDAVSRKLFLLEINPRFTLWNHLGAANGVNLPRLAYDHLTGRRVAVDRALGYRTTTRWLSGANDCRAFLRDYRASGEVSWGEWLRTFRGPLVFDVFSWSDPLPAVVALAHYAKALSRRLAAGIPIATVEKAPAFDSGASSGP